MTNAAKVMSGSLRVALLGNPNCGKTALFNLLTGSRQKVANYAGVTVERKEGQVLTASGHRVMVLDLPGAYSLNALSADEAVTRDIVIGRRPGEPLPDRLVCVADATNLQLNLRLVLEARALDLPMVLALNMSDAARRAGIVIDRDALSRELGMPVVETVGVRHDGAHELLRFLDDWPASGVKPDGIAAWQAPTFDQVMGTQLEVRRIMRLAVQSPAGSLDADDAIDRVVLHPLWGMLLLCIILFLMFQAVFSWATLPMDAIKSAVEWLSSLLRTHMPEGVLQSLLTDGILAGAGGVLVFLPQILILFFFILVLEDSGYLPRAAFLLDRVMGSVGLSGRSFIPLLSSFACAIPGVMATRTITHRSLGGGKPVAVDFSLIVRDASQFSAGNAGRALSRRPLLPAQRSDTATARAARALGPGSPDGLRVAGACAGACREHCAGFTVAAASSLVICRNTLYRKMRG